VLAGGVDRCAGGPGKLGLSCAGGRCIGGGPGGSAAPRPGGRVGVGPLNFDDGDGGGGGCGGGNWNEEGEPAILPGEVAAGSLN